MWIDNKIVKEDLEYICSCDFIPWEDLRNKTIFITGATGLIGQNLVNGLLYANIIKGLNIKVVGLVRNLEKAKEKFNDQLKDTNLLEFVIGDVRTFKYPDCSIDYIVHGASITASKDFVEKADEVKDIAINGTKHVLELAKEKKVSSFVYLSSMEVYGYPEKGHVCVEEDTWDFDPNVPRNSYPIAKQECEKLCKEYYDKYGISTKVIRLAQTFGPGVDIENDNRIFAYIARCIKNNEDIVLHTKGETERCYLYTADAVTAILTVLLKGKGKEIYNAANPETYCSIIEMVKQIKDAFNRNLCIKYEIDKMERGYNNTTYYKLDINSISNLGWKYCFNMFDMYKNTIESSIKKIMVVAMHIKNGGAERVLSLLMNQWIKEGNKVCLVQTDVDKEKVDQYNVNSSIELINISSNKNKLLSIAEKVKQLIKIANDRKDYTIISFVNPCILIVSLASFFITNKIIFSERCDPYHSPKNPFKRFFRTICFYCADKCVFQTNEAMEYFPKTIRKKGIVIYNPVDNNMPNIEDININDNRIIMACRLDKQKNITMAIEAFCKVIKKHPEYVLEIYGSGSEKEKLLSFININGLKNSVKINDFTNNIYDIMKTSKLLISTSLYEGISNSILEAMAIGLPCICTDCPIGGSRLLIDNRNNGILIKNNDVISLYKEICELLENNNYLKKLSNNAKIVREKFSLNNIATKWLRIL